MTNFQLCGEVPKPREWPLIRMSQFGLVPGTEKPLFRIVFASSVKTLMGGEVNGVLGYHVRPRYRNLGDQWILEKWISGFECTRMDEATYNAMYKDPKTGLILTGPYPRDGVYFYCDPPLGPYPKINIALITALIKKAKFNSFAANKAAIEAETEKEQKAKFQYQYDKIKDSYSVGGIRPANVGGMVKAQKSLPPIQDARKFGLPTRGARIFKPSEMQLSVAGF